MTVRPDTFIRQWDGSPSASVNCGCASEAVAVERDWLNTKTGDSSNIRDWITANCDDMTGEPGAGSGWSTSKGTQMRQTAAAVLALYGTALTYRYAFDWDSVFPATIVGGRGATVSSILGRLYGTASTIRHRVFVNERRWNTTAGYYDYLVFDPNRYSAEWISSARLKSAMVAAGTEMNVTRNTEQADRKILFSGAHLRATPTNLGVDGGSAAKGSIITFSGSAVVGQSVTVAGGGTSNLWRLVIAKDGVLLAAAYYVPVVYLRPE